MNQNTVSDTSPKPPKPLATVPIVAVVEIGEELIEGESPIKSEKPFDPVQVTNDALTKAQRQNSQETNDAIDEAIMEAHK